ncbi:MAG: hypothetical protein AAFV32_10190 [Myxococcota bacterium]
MDEMWAELSLHTGFEAEADKCGASVVGICISDGLALAGATRVEIPAVGEGNTSEFVFG